MKANPMKRNTLAFHAAPVPHAPSHELSSPSVLSICLSITFTITIPIVAAIPGVQSANETCTE